MRIREYSLPSGWYPRDPQEVSGEISRSLSKFAQNAPFLQAATAAISPHAGWYYCCRPMSLAISSLKSDAETIVVLGGHLPQGYPMLFAMEDAVKTPLGPMPIDAQLRGALQNELKSNAYEYAEDRYRDNTVEVLLPMVRHFFLKASLIWLRLPADTVSFEAGRIIAQVSAELKRKVNVLASTDLTHYGRNYGFSPKGSGQSALDWVRGVNDANFIKAVLEGDAEEALHRAEQDRSACSAGAVLGAMGFAKETGAPNARLLEYTTSAEMNEGEAPDSFVGYAAISF
jgi:AmmeMemoRadiSam system protein B